jgi:ribosomal protein S18 acetylase RimI-like enzyme
VNPTLRARPAREEDLPAILALQRQNLASSLTADEAGREGFVTVVHTLEILQEMHRLAPSLVVQDGATLAGYALAMPLGCRAFLPVLEPMFRLFEGLMWQGRPLATYRYYVMGQICVARDYRGRGVVQALYRGHAELHGSDHDLVVTEIAARNGRSLRAHEKVGFVEIGRHRDATDDWVVVAWDFQ